MPDSTNEKKTESGNGGTGRVYCAIDLKSFYASVECVERGIDPLTAKLVVADESRTDKTICLAVSPALKALGVPGRPRLFEVKQILEERRRRTGEETEYIIAPPRMAFYMYYSTTVYEIYLRYIAPEDIHVYSIDEVFIDLTGYLRIYGLSPHDLTMKLVRTVLKETGITATAGIGTNMYLAKIAMDVLAKKAAPDKDGVRIAYLDEMLYRTELWNHRPITDFWRVAAGTARRLASQGMYTMGDVARCSLGKPEAYHNQELLFRLFGVNAELLIDHAWGWEPVGMAEIKSYVPESRSLSTGQVLQRPYDHDGGRLIIREMADLLSLDLVKKGLVTDQLVLTVGYDVESLRDPAVRKKYSGPVKRDHYGRKVPRHAHGTINLPFATAATRILVDSFTELYDRITEPDLLVRRAYLVAARIRSAADEKEQENEHAAEPVYEQMDLFQSESETEALRAKKAAAEKEMRLQEAIVSLQEKYGKNTVLKGMNFEEGAMTIERNSQVGGHKA